MNILIIDDEPQIRKLLKISLEANGYKTFDAQSGREGLIQAAMAKPDLVILDLGLPDEDGLEILKQIREWSKIPVIVLTVRNAEEEKILLLDAGADDYVTKPFGTGELLARIRAALRRSEHKEEMSLFLSGNLTVDLSARVVKINNEPVKLTATEYSIVNLFVQNAGKVLTHRQIMKEIWGNQFAEDTQYLRVYMGQIRKKLEEDPASPKLFVTESGIGYRLDIL
jgi:two-component system KDP operon response regulator KdpE